MDMCISFWSFFPQPTSENPILNGFYATMVFIRIYGEIGVDIFLLLSGVGLYFAYSKITSLVTFYKRRFARIIIPYALTQIAYFPVAIFLWNISVKEQIERATLVSFWSRQELSSWYIASILAYYFIYPLIHIAIVVFNTKKVSLLFVKAIVFTTLSICFGVFIEYLAPSIYTLHLRMFLWRLPVFVFGCCIGEIVFLRCKVSRFKILLISFFGFSIGVIFWYLFNAKKVPDPHILSCAHLLQIPFSFAVCVFVADFCSYHQRVSRLRKFLITCGGLSLEFYLLFEKVVQPIYKFWIYVELVVRKFHPLWVDNFGLIRNVLAFIIMFQLAKLLSTITKKIRNGIHPDAIRCR
jgi:peptidoglycan/LPS O-acetylase OafA/YrhL